MARGEPPEIIDTHARGVAGRPGRTRRATPPPLEKKFKKEFAPGRAACHVWAMDTTTTPQGRAGQIIVAHGQPWRVVGDISREYVEAEGLDLVRAEYERRNVLSQLYVHRPAGSKLHLIEEYKDGFGLPSVL